MFSFTEDDEGGLIKNEKVAMIIYATITSKFRFLRRLVRPTRKNDSDSSSESAAEDNNYHRKTLGFYVTFFAQNIENLITHV